MQIRYLLNYEDDYEEEKRSMRQRVDRWNAEQPQHQMNGGAHLNPTPCDNRNGRYDPSPLSRYSDGYDNQAPSVAQPRSPSVQPQSYNYPLYHNNSEGEHSIHHVKADRTPHLPPAQPHLTHYSPSSSNLTSFIDSSRHKNPSSSSFPEHRDHRV
jgi:hypothetical protein